MRRHVTILCAPVAILLAMQAWTMHALGKPPAKTTETTATRVHEPNTPVDETRQRLVQLGETASSGDLKAVDEIEKNAACREPRRPKGLTVKFVYDNYAFDESFKTNWGFACVVEGAEKTILFDTGQKGELLLENLAKMKIDPGSPELVVLSHNHGDHAGGLAAFLAKNHDVSAYLPASCPKEFVAEVETAGAKVVSEKRPVEICENVFLTGEMGEAIKEQGLVLDRGDGLVLITGCAHPGIVAMTKRAKEHLEKDVVMVLGGFHLNQLSASEAKGVAEQLKELGVCEVGPTHCTGKEAIAAFEEVFGKNFLRLGVGKTLAISMAP